ncbi:MAG: DUF2141 domain-containing protein [Acidobacteria bacterium]|nr:DUF2141 domain-containing protein [Acidobacteriota bacterium]
MTGMRVCMLSGFVATLCGISQSMYAAEITVQVSGFRNDKGSAIIYLWNGKSGFPRDTTKSFQQKPVPIEGTSAKVTFTDIAPGDYAVSVTHDENSSGKMDTGFMGRPKEGYGVSNNIKKFLPPSFDECKITLDDNGKTIDIQVRY